MRLLLGFEEPDNGSVFFDNHDLSVLEKKSLRQNIGVVMQDSRLFAGSIYQNISISNPGMPMDDAWAVAESAGIAADIREMPMGMNTFVDETASNISGGQKQRIIIARALAAKPNILFFDEATSALDNVTQKIVTDTLNSLDCTRIVIAHRLSTIKSCQRILMLEGGHIIEDGTYEELMGHKGNFAEMVKRQQIME
ncbi:MAG: ATP-binding cassette domain-containing protein [Parasporobacterium sp.]|nr:ATP-binding cassette domain-containing protein [Parasporobacterium sp.]